MAHHARASRAGAAIKRGLGLSGIRTVGSNLFGRRGYGSYGYGYGNGGYGYGGGHRYRHSGYVKAYIPGDGWVLVPIRAIRHI
jgi:hypothetical protein